MLTMDEAEFTAEVYMKCDASEWQRYDYLPISTNTNNKITRGTHISAHFQDRSVDLRSSEGISQA